MKKFLPSAFLLVLTGVSLSQEQPAILSDLVDGSEPKIESVRAVFKAGSVTDTKTLFEGSRKITVQRLALDPRNPVKPVVKEKAVTTLSYLRPSLVRQESPRIAEGFPLIHLSAAVYPGPISRVTWAGRNSQGRFVEYSGWSNVDFNHFAGFNSFLGTDGKPRTFLLAVANDASDTKSSRSLRLPSFPSTTPTFLPDGKILDRDLIPILSLHKLYEKEAPRLSAAFRGRERVRLAKQAELLANPPQPQDLTIRYRIAETPLPSSAKGGAR